MYLSIKLTLKQKKFADEYIISGNATDAAKKAGYSEKTAFTIATENLKKPYIKQYIDQRIKELDDKKIAKQEEVLQYLTSVLRGESKSAIVVVEGLGDGVSEARTVKKTPDEKERLKAAELLGKRYRIFSEKSEAEEEQMDKLDKILGAIDDAAKS
jgi:terminase small subunit